MWNIFFFFLSIPHCLYNLKKKEKGWYERFEKKKIRVRTLCRASCVSTGRGTTTTTTTVRNLMDGRIRTRRTRDHMVVCANLIYTLENRNWKNSTGSRALIAVGLCKRKTSENKLTREECARNTSVIMPFVAPDVYLCVRVRFAFRSFAHALLVVLLCAGRASVLKLFSFNCCECTRKTYRPRDRFTLVISSTLGRWGDTEWVICPHRP